MDKYRKTSSVACEENAYTLIAMPIFHTGNKLHSIDSYNHVLIMQFNNHVCRLSVKWFSGECMEMKSNVAYVWAYCARLKLYISVQHL
jgi:hypothetical protein